MALNDAFTAGQILTALEMNNLPFGRCGSASATADQTGISSAVDLTSLTVTWTAVSSRYYRTTLYLPVLTQNATAGYVIGRITDGSATLKQAANHLAQTGDQFQMIVMTIETGLSGSTTRKGRLSTSAGTVDLTLGASSPAWIAVEDIGST